MTTIPPNNAFYTQLGKALDAWATLELVLSWWFGYLTGMEGAMARAIFYSANSFSTKRDMLRMALEQAELSWRSFPMPGVPAESLKAAPKQNIDFLKAAFKKAGQYSGARNSVAHRMTVHNQSRDEYSLVDRGQWWSETGITLTHLTEMEERISKLKDILRDVFTFVVSPQKSLPKMPPSEGLTRVQQLPNEAHSPTATQN